ncbi:MAG TPA: succinate dehydrogenase cytochrome b558 subunit [Lacipirellulaceae bacterium]
MDQPEPSFLTRHEFVIRRLHSLSGLIPVGAYMVVHLVTNATVLNGPGTFQDNVYKIHSLGRFLPEVEWTFIFIPILFHAIVGIWIVMGMNPNTTSYPYVANRRYNWQRITGMIAFFFIGWHVFQMHGWFHNEAWLTDFALPYGGAQFRPFNAASTAGKALASGVVTVAYVIGILACVFHLANGIWTMGITWGVWTSPKAQSRALAVCTVFGLVLGAIGLGGLGGMRAQGSGDAYNKAIEIENKMYEGRVQSGELIPDQHKRSRRPMTSTDGDDSVNEE